MKANWLRKAGRRISWYLLIFILVFVLLSILLVLPFRWLNPPVTAVMAERWLTAEDDYTLNKSWLSWPDIPKQAALAVVTSEDQRFPIHVGIDITAIKQAFKERQRRGELRGASTISQQVARNMFLWTGRSWLRKGLEAWFTLLVEWLWGKQRILEVYLNIAEWGPGVFGLQAASQYHYKKPAAQLTPMESALLAATLPSPLNYDPSQPADHLYQRARWNIEQQRRLGGVNWLNSLH